MDEQQYLSVSNIYTRTKQDFVPGIPIGAYKTPLPAYVQEKLPEETFQSQFPSKGGKVPCDTNRNGGAFPGQWCQKWGGECPLGRRVVPSRQADPVMARGMVPMGTFKPVKQEVITSTVKFDKYIMYMLAMILAYVILSQCII